LASPDKDKKINCKERRERKEADTHGSASLRYASVNEFAEADFAIIASEFHSPGARYASRLMADDVCAGRRPVRLASHGR
jgi:hypothetical protein